MEQELAMDFMKGTNYSQLESVLTTARLQPQKKQQQLQRKAKLLGHGRRGMSSLAGSSWLSLI
jgi:hypothetical protein